VVLKDGPWYEHWKIRLLPLTTFVSDVFYGFRTQTMLPMPMYDSEPALHRSCCRSSKQDGSVCLHSCGKDGRLAWLIQSPTYVDPRALRDWRRLPGRPRHIWLRTLEARPWAELSLATHQRSRTIEAAGGNGYAPARDMLVMMIMTWLGGKESNGRSSSFSSRSRESIY